MHSTLLPLGSTMAGRHFQCLSLMLDSSYNEANTALDLRVAMDDVMICLGGMTIVSAPEDFIWLGIGGAPSGMPSRLLQSAPAQVCAPSCLDFSSSLLIVSSMLMELPPLCTFTPVGKAGGASGGWNSWLPSLDRNAILDATNKLQPTQMVYIGAEEKICFRMISKKRLLPNPTRPTSL